MESNYKHFEDSEENKLIYTDLHRQYVILTAQMNSQKKNFFSTIILILS